MNDDPIRPRDLALLLLAAGGEPPRQRARDQQADRLGIDLRQRMLDRLAALDPEPDAIEAALAAIAGEVEGPSGPPRAVALSILQDWDSARIGPGFVSWLMTEAVAASRDDRPRRKAKGKRGDDVA